MRSEETSQHSASQLRPGEKTDPGQTPGTWAVTTLIQLWLEANTVSCPKWAESCQTGPGHYAVIRVKMLT